MREKEFTADVGDTGVNLLVQQVVTGVLELAHLDVAQRPRPVPDGIDRGDPVVGTVNDQDWDAGVGEFRPPVLLDRTARNAAQHCGGKIVIAMSQHRQRRHRTQGMAHHRLRDFGQFRQSDVSERGCIGSKIGERSPDSRITLRQTVPGVIDRPHVYPRRRHCAREAVILAAVLTETVQKDQ